MHVIDVKKDRKNNVYVHRAWSYFQSEPENPLDRRTNKQAAHDPGHLIYGVLPLKSLRRQNLTS